MLRFKVLDFGGLEFGHLGSFQASGFWGLTLFLLLLLFCITINYYYCYRLLVSVSYGDDTYCCHYNLRALLHKPQRLSQAEPYTHRDPWRGKAEGGRGLHFLK